jgi:hypothetical protein
MKPVVTAITKEGTGHQCIWDVRDKTGTLAVICRKLYETVRFFFRSSRQPPSG